MQSYHLLHINYSLYLQINFLKFKLIDPSLWMCGRRVVCLLFIFSGHYFPEQKLPTHPPPLSSLYRFGLLVMFQARTAAQGSIFVNPTDEELDELMMMMHLKCIHELCTIIVIFQSYLHHIRGILLLFNDFW